MPLGCLSDSRGAARKRGLDLDLASGLDNDVSREPRAVRAAIGVTGQFSAVDNLLTGEENLALMADLAHLSRSEGRRRTVDLLERFDLVGAAKRPTMTYSGWHAPPIGPCHDPRWRTTGHLPRRANHRVGPRSRHTMWEIIQQLAASGVTIFLTTQHLDEADQLASHIAVLERGRLVAQGTPAGLKRVIPGGHVELRFVNLADLETTTQLVGADDAGRDHDALTLRVRTDASVSALRILLERLDDHAAPVESLSVHTPDLEDVYFGLTGHGEAVQHTAEGQQP